MWLRHPRRNWPNATGMGDVDEVGVCVTHITAKSGMAQSTVSLYLSTLARAGLLIPTRIGQWTHYRVDEERLAAVAAVLLARAP